MTTHLTINGEKRPFIVGMGALIEFERRTGKNFLQVASNLSISDICTLAYCSFLVGARANKQNFELEETDFIDKIDQEIGFKKIVSLITEGLGKLGMAATEETNPSPSLSQ